MSAGIGLSRRQALGWRTHRASVLRLPAAAVAVFFCALHLPLAIGMHHSRALASAHALATVAIGLWWAIGGRHPHRVILAAAYVTGAEVLWRMTKAGVFWEYGKYAVCAIFLVGMARNFGTRIPALPLFYFAFLLPSALITLTESDPSLTRMLISFNLSGPLCLMICACFFYHRQISLEALRGIVIAFLSPVLGIAALAIFGIATAEELKFDAQSNPITSGGFGPNQVSGILGLGALLAFLSMLNGRESGFFRAAMLVVTLALAAQSALTFSRGGLYAAVGAGAIAAFYMARHRQARLRLALAAVLLGLISHFCLFPLLDSFTHGALSRRFQDTSPTGRDVLIQADLQLWFDNVVFGVGPGQATDLRAEWYSRRAAGHTEFTRMLAEHGLLGLLSLFSLGMLAVRNLRNARMLFGRAFAAALMGWSLLFMLNSGVRLAAPGFIFGLAAARLLFTETDSCSHFRRSHRSPARLR